MAQKYAEEGNLVYKCGNVKSEKSRFNFLYRWHLERTLLNYNNQKHSMFLYAYREFIRAMAQNDKVTLKKMAEPKLYSAIQENHKKLKSLNMEYFTVDDKIKLKMKLMDV